MNARKEEASEEEIQEAYEKVNQFAHFVIHTARKHGLDPPDTATVGALVMGLACVNSGVPQHAQDRMVDQACGIAKKVVSRARSTKDAPEKDH